MEQRNPHEGADVAQLQAYSTACVSQCTASCSPIEPPREIAAWWFREHDSRNPGLRGSRKTGVEILSQGHAVDCDTDISDDFGCRLQQELQKIETTIKDLRAKWGRTTRSTPDKSSIFEPYVHLKALVETIGRELLGGEQSCVEECKSVDEYRGQVNERDVMIAGLKNQMLICRAAADELSTRLQERTAAYEEKDASQVRRISKLERELEAANRTLNILNIEAGGGNVP